MTLKEAIQDYNQWRNPQCKQATVYEHGRYLMYLSLFLRNPYVKIENIDLKDITEFINLSLDIGWGDHNVAGKAQAIRVFFEYFKKRGFDVIDPTLIPVPRVRAKLPRVASKEDYKAILSHLEKSNNPVDIRNMAVLRMFYDTAIRNTELCGINIRDIDLKNKRAIIESKKSRTFPYREIFWSRETNKYLLRWLKTREDIEKLIIDKDALFVCLDNRNFGKRIHKSGIGDMLRVISASLGIETLNAHSLRHLFGVDCAKKNMNNSNISTLMGHANLNYSLRYTRLHGTELKKQHLKVRT